MKIYPNKSIVAVTKEVNPLTDIPLSYIDTSATSYSVTTVINENYKIKSKKEILPYDRVENFICLFDKHEKQIPYNEIFKNFQKDGNEYFYSPYGAHIFDPKKFEYSVTIKKTIKYSSNMPYNIKALVPNNPILANNLMTICGDAPQRLVAPANVLINNGDLSLASLTNGNILKTDLSFFVFDSKKTILEYDPIDKDFVSIDFNISNILNELTTNIVAIYKEDFAEKEPSEEEHMNIMELSEPNGFKFMIGSEAISYKVKNSILYDNIEFSTNKYFTVPKNTDNLIYHNIFDVKDKTPILIEEHVGKGFVIYLSEGIIEKASINNKVIYESLCKVFFSAYQRTNSISEWITDVIPDYIVSNKKIIKKDKFISNMELYKMFGLAADEVIPHEVNIDKVKYPFIKFTGMSKNYLTFEKDISGDNIKYSDPKKPEGTISIYTQNQNIIYFDDFIYSINDSIEDNIKVDIFSNEIIITTKTFRHSSSGIYVKYVNEPIKISLIKVVNNKEEQIQNADYYLIVKENDSASFFETVLSTDYKKEMGDILVTIQIRKDATDKIVYDMRQRGGGLDPFEKDNYDCFDIGHIIGRPYRKAGALIINLPKYLEVHKDIITQTIKQYSVAEDYPIIIFKED